MEPNQGLMRALWRRAPESACPRPSLTPPGDWRNGKGRRLIKEIIRFITGRRAAAAAARELRSLVRVAGHRSRAG